MRKAVVFSLVVFAPLLFFLSILFISLGRLEQPPVAVQAGRRVWQDRGCTECHTVFGDGGYTAKEITSVYSERGPEWLGSFFDQPPMLTPHFRHPMISGEQRGWLLEFLSYIDTLPLGNWPPGIDRSKSTTKGRQP